MRILRKCSTLLLGTAMLAALALVACSDNGNGEVTPPAAEGASETTAAPPATVGGTINLVYVEWTSCVASTNVVKALLEDAGFKVKTTSVSAAAMYEAVAGGDADATLCAWLPITHESYYTKTRDRLDKLGPSIEQGTRLGLAVPDYVTIDSITELPDQASRFKDRIIGIDPGAGLMELTQKVIDQYQLPLQLVSGSDATMAAALKSAIDSDEWIVVTAWSPHWMWDRWDLKYLDDPEGVYGKPDNIETLARKGLKQDMPAAWTILSNFHWTAAQMEEVMAMNQKDEDSPADNARLWLSRHPDEVAQWTSGI